MSFDSIPSFSMFDLKKRDENTICKLKLALTKLKNLNLKKQPFKHLVLKDLKRQKDKKVWCFQSVVL